MLKRYLKQLLPNNPFSFVNIYMNSNYNSNAGYGTTTNYGSTTSSRESGIKDFLNSNNLVARLSFLLLVIFLFVVILQLLISLIGWFLNPSDSPKLINGMVNASQMLIIPQDPSQTNAKTISRSVNSPNGIEFTWSVWIFINDIGYNSTYQHIFHKGNYTLASNGLNEPNNAPGLYISPYTNELTVIMNTYNVIDEQITIPDIPLNKWVNVIIRCRNTSLDVYINGTIAKSMELFGVPKQNYGNIYVGLNGGFNGNVSNLWYYNYALGTIEIQNLVKRGPNTKMVGSSAMSMKNPNYLSLRWYFYGNDDMYNP